jgi:hypothetical protein
LVRISQEVAALQDFGWAYRRFAAVSTSVDAGDRLRGHQAEADRMDFTGKVGVVTGGGNGIGCAASVAFARHGAKVVVVDHDSAGAQATIGIIRQNGGEALAVTADVKTVAGEVARQGIRVRYAHDPCAGRADLARQLGGGRGALPGRDTEWPLHDRGRDRQHGAFSLLQPRL